MAQTVKEFGVKITSDTKDLQTGFDKLKIKLEELSVSFKQTFGVFDSETKKISKELSQTIGKNVSEIGKNAEAQITQVQKATDEKLKAVTKGSKEEKAIVKQNQDEINKIKKEGIKAQNAQLRQQTQEAARELKNQLKVLDREAEQFGELDVVQINKTQPIQDVQELGRVIKSSNKTTQEEIRTQLKRLDGQKIADIKDAEQKLKRILARAQGNQTQAAKEAAKRRLQQADLTAEKRLKIEQDLQRQLLRIQQQGVARQQATRQTSARRQQQAPGERRTGRIGRGGALISELGGAAQGASSRLGVLGQVLGKLGPIGIAVGAALAVTIGTLLKAADAAGKLGDEIAKVKTTINPKQFDELSGATQRLRDFSAKTGVELSELTDGMFNAASAVTAFKNDVNAGAEAVIIASRAAVGMSTDSGNLVSVMGDLANSFSIDASETENLNFIMDTVSQTFRDGKISGDELSSTIVKAAKSTSLLSRDAKEGLSALNAMTASMTASGINATETATAIDALQNEFLDLPKATKLIEAGLGGISTEGGKVQVDFQELFESAGDDFEKYAQLLGSKRAKLAFRTLAGGGESAFLAISEGFQDVSGRSQDAFEIMQDTSEAATKRLDASFNELMISIGGSADSAITNLTNFAAEALGGLAGLFKSAEQQAAESQEVFDKSIETANAIGAAIKEVDKSLESLGPLSAGQVEDEINRIGEAANQFKDQFPLIADNIQRIINAEGEKTVQTIAMLNEQLGRAQDLAQSEAFLAGFEGAEQGIEAISDSISDAASSTLEWSDAVFILNPAFAAVGALLKGEDFAAEIQSKLEGISELDVLGSLNVQIEGMNDRLKQLDEERDGIDKTTEEGAKRLRDINLEIKDVIVAKGEAARGIASVETTVTKEIEKQLENAKQLAVSLGEEFNIQNEIENIRFNIVEETGAEGETLKLINDTLRQKGLLIATELGDKKATIDLQNQGIELQIKELQAQKASLDLVGLLTEEQRAAVDAQIESLGVNNEAYGVSVDRFDIIEDQLSVNEDMIGAEEAISDELEKQVDLSDEKSFIDEAVNELTSEILDNETLTTDEKIAQLDLLIEQQDVQLQTLNDSIKAEQDKLIAQEEFNKMSAEEQENALKTAEAIRKQVAALNEEVAIVTAAKTGIVGKKEETETKARVRGAIGGGRDRDARDAQRAQRTQERDAAKAEKERLKEQERMQKARDKQEDDAAKAREKLENEREKRREEDAQRITEMLNKEIEARQKAREKLIKINEQKIEAEKKATESIREFRNALEETINKTRLDLISGMSQALSGFDTLKDEFEKVASKATGLVQLSREQLIDSVREQAIALIGAQEEIRNVNRTMLIQNGIIGDVENAVTGVSGDITKTAVTDRVLDATEFGRDIATIAINQRATLSSQKNALITAGITGELLQDVIDRVQDGFSEERAITVSRINPALRNIVSALEKMKVDLSNTDTGNADAIIAVLESIEKRTDAVLTRPVETQTDVGFAELRGIAEFTTLSELFKLLGDNLRGALTSFQAAGSLEQFEAAGLEFSRLTEDLGLAQFSLNDMQTNYADLLEVIELVTKVFNAELADAALTQEQITELSKDFTEEQLKHLELLNNREAISQEDLALLRTKIPLLIQQTEQLQQQVDFQNNLALSQAALLESQESITEAISVTTNLANEYETALADQEVTVESINQKYVDQLKALEGAAEVLESAKQVLLIQKGALTEQKATQEELLEIDRQKLLVKQALLAEDPTSAEVRSEIDALNTKIREQEDHLADLTEKEVANQEQLDNTTVAIDTNTEAQEKNNKVKKEELDLFDKKQVADFITEMTAQIGMLNSTSLTGFVSSIGNSLRGVTDLFEKAAEATGENAEDLRDAAMEGMSKIAVDTAQVFEQVAANVEQGFEKITNIAKQFKAGVSGAITTGVGDLTTQIGKALIGAGGPLAVAGAVILGVGLITKAVGQIINAIKGREQTALEKAEERLATIERQNDEIRSQIALMNDLAALGDASVDTARERLDLLEKQKQELIKQNAEFDKPQEALLEEKRDLEGLVTQYEDFNDRLEQGREFSNSAQRKLVRDFNEAFGTAFDFGDNITKSDIDDLVALTSGHIAVAQGDLEKLELITEVNESILQEQFNLLSERVKSAEFRIKIATEFEDPDLFLQSQEDLINTLGDKLNTALLKAGVGTQITDLTKDELLNLRDEFEALFAEGEVPADIIDSWGELLEAIEGNNQKEREFVEAMLEDEKQMIELIRLREGADEITEKQANEQVLKILEDELAIVDEQIEALGLTNELEMLRLGLLQEINDLKNDNNDADEEANRLLTIALRNRQQLLESIRAEQGGAPISIEQQNRLAQSEEQIVNQLRATGMSDPDIQSFLTTLPAFEEGGIVPKTGPVIAHEGEWIIPANQVKEIEDQIKSFASIFAANNPTIMGTDAITQDFTRTVLEKEAQNIQNNAQINTQFGDIIINIPSGVEEPEKIALAVKNELDGMVLGTVQRGIDQNKLDFRGKKT